MGTRIRRNDTRRTVAHNVRALLNLRKWSEHTLAKQSGIAQKTINNILSGRSAPTVDTTGAIAKAFGLTAWHLLIPDLPTELVTSPSLEKLVADWIHSTKEGREHIELVARREGQLGRK